MIMSPLGIALVQFFEAYADKAYRRFPHEPWTCGWGHTRGVIETTTCTSMQALLWLKEDLADAERHVNTFIRVQLITLTQHQYDALVSLAYNIGVGGFAAARQLQDAVATRQWARVAALFEQYAHVDGKENDGILRRRKLEGALFLDGITA